MQKINFQNLPNTTTPVNDTNLNLLQDNVENALNLKADTSSLPTVNDATLTIQANSTTVATFTANASTNETANLTIPTKTSDLVNDSFLTETVLYNDATGSTTDITLSDSVANYDYVDIYYYESNKSDYSSTRVYAPNNKKVSLSINAYHVSSSDLYQYFYTKIINFSGTNLTVEKNFELRILNNNISTHTTNATIYITRVVGIK